MNVTIKQIQSTDNLATICEQMQPDNWAADNQMTSYHEESLKKYLSSSQNILLLAYSEEKIVGAVIAYILPHPDSTNSSLYVHELDTHPSFRRQGVGTVLMQAVFRLAKSHGLGEVWIGTETDNDAANSLYRKLNPYEEEASIIYSYKIKPETNV